MIGRQAAALLGGAAAVHLADFALHAGELRGLAGFGQGHALVFALAALPAVLFAWAAWDGRAAGASFVLGACLGYAADEWLLLPSFGFGWTTAVWLVPWILVRLALLRGGAAEAPRAGVVLLAGASVLGAAAGAAFALLRPFLFQHVTGSREGVRIAVLTGLLALLAGVALGGAMKRRMPRVGVAIFGSVFAAVGVVTTFLLLPRASGGLTIPFFSGPWSAAWWGRSILASWSMLGLGTVAVGILASLLDRRKAVPFWIAGLCIGTWVGEAAIRRVGRDPVAARAFADEAARHPALARIEAAAFDPDGIWTRFRTRTLLDVEPVGFVHAARIDRGSLWQNLAAAETEPAVPSEALRRSWLAWPQAAEKALKAADSVWPSFGFLPKGFTLRDTVESLREAGETPWRVPGGAGSFRVWADPRAFRPEGLRTLLATWREALPNGTFQLLIDGYNGPLIGVRVGGKPELFPIARQLVLFDSKVAEAFRNPPTGSALLSPSTNLRPILEWQTAPEPSPFLHPTAPVMRALVDTLAIDPESTTGRILRGLVLHAEAQVVRPYVVSQWDHVAVPEQEVAEYMTALAQDERSQPLIRHLQIVFEVLFKKREYAVLVKYLEEAVARRPDVFAFHRTLGKTYHDILSYPNAVEELLQARALQPDHHEVAIELSRALGGAKRWPEAVLILEAELQKHDEPDVRKGLAIALLEAGETERARAMLKALALQYPADLDIMKAQDRLERETAPATRR